MKIVTLILALVVSTWSASATVILFDIGPVGGLDGDGGLSQATYDGSVYNRMGQTAGNVDHGGIQDDAGVELLGLTLRANGVDGRGGNGTLNAGWGSAEGIAQTAIDSWYFRGAGTMTLTLGGLAPGSEWMVEVANAFNTAANISDIQANGNFADGTTGPSGATDGDGWDRAANGFVSRELLVFPSVTADGGGAIALTFTGNNPTVQALRFTSVVPEPGTLALFAGGMLFLLRLRRR